MDQVLAVEERDGSAAPPARHRRAHRGRMHRSVAVGAVAVLAGALFAINAALFRSSGERHAEDLPGLVALEQTRTAETAAEVEALRGDVDRLVDEAAGATAIQEDPALAFAAGRVAVTGPGVVVRLWDAPVDSAPAGARPDDLLVHQQDLEAVINALWAGGAEAMTIQGQRVTSLTAVRCVGNVLLLHGMTYSPPYEIAAIGDPARLTAALDSSPGVQVYLQYVAAVRLGWSMTTQTLITMPAADATSTLRYASVPADGVDVEAAAATDGSGGR